MTDFNYLPFNKTCVYDFPLENINSYCRSGTVKTDRISSFINAVLNACSKKFLTTRDEDSKIKQIDDFIKYITNEIKNSISFTSYKNKTKDLFFDILKTNYDSIDNDDDDELNVIIRDIIPLDSYKKIINRVMKKWNDNKNKTFIDNIISETMIYLEYEEILDDIEIEKAEYIKKHICNFNNTINDKIKIIVNEPDEPNDINELLIKYISEHFDCNIYIIDFDKKTPLSIYDYKKQNYIVIISFDDVYYEIFGKCLPNNKIQREFGCNDNIIKSLKK